MQQHQYFPVNWIDGMKVNKSHFITQNNACTWQVAQGVSGLLNSYNYGLLPNTQQGSNNLKLFVTTDNQQHVHVRIQKCKAITIGGYIIEFDEDTFLNSSDIKAQVPGLSLPISDLKKISVEYLIVLIVNPYERVPYGNADPTEIPPRHPYTVPSYTLQLMPVNEAGKNVVGEFHLPVGRLMVQEQEVLMDDRYIGPCCCINSHYDLLEVHAALEQFFGKMELYALQIIQKILQKKQQNDMAAIVQKLCEQVAVFTASAIAEFKLINIYQPPVFLIKTISSFARLIKNTLDFYIGSGKEELINYCTEWCDVNQGEMEGVITSLANHQYKHLDINDSVEKISGFTKIIAHLFAGLARLDYIGKRKDPGIFVKEQIISTQPEVQAKRRSFLAE